MTKELIQEKASPSYTAEAKNQARIGLSCAQKNAERDEPGEHDAESPAPKTNIKSHKTKKTKVQPEPAKGATGKSVDTSQPGGYRVDDKQTNLIKHWVKLAKQEHPPDAWLGSRVLL